jgi:hypothetical protein
MEMTIAQRRDAPPADRVLTLPLKAEYFDQVKAGIKPREYRLVNEYWRKRLINKTYTHVHLTRGYAARSKVDSHIVLPWRGYIIEEITHPHFGPHPVSVFSIDVSGAANHD